MKRIFVVGTFITLLASIVACQTSDTTSAAPQQEVVKYTAAQFFETTSVFGSSINHDATAVLVSSDKTGVYNAYRYPVDGSAPKQLTHSTTDTIYGVSWFPEDDRFIYTKDAGGNELNHVFVSQLNGEAIDVTPGEKLKARFAGWHQDKSSFFVLNNQRDPKSFDLYQHNLKDYKGTLIYENTNNWEVSSFSKDGRWIALKEAVSNADSNLYLVDLHSKKGKPTLITPHKGDINYSTYSFTPDSSKLVYATDEHGEFNQAWQYDLVSGESTLFYKSDWDVSSVYYSKNGDFRVVSTNEDAQTRLHISDTITGKEVKLPTLPAGDLRGVNFSNDSSMMVFYINSDTSPSNLFSYKIGSMSAKRLTESLSPDIDEKQLATSSVERFKSFDELVVPGLLYKPKSASASNKVPALIWIHGGPGGQSRKGYSAAIQHLVNQGYAIFAVNNRGSSGYGKTFYHLDDRKHGEDDLQDIVYGKKYLLSQDWIDAERIGVIGGSYGGFLTMAAMAFTDEFKVGINIFGVTNWERTMQSIPPWWESFKKYLYDEMGDPVTDAARHRRISPLFHADKITQPVLVVQGANDPRVLQVESDEMVAAIKLNNVPVEYVLFDDEGHGFRKKVNRVTASEAYLAFLKKYM